MKQAIQLKVDKPCSENWDQMDQAAQGRFCQLCEKTVIDFTKMSDREIVNHLQSNKKICGRLSNKQLDKSYPIPTTISNIKKWALASTFSSLLLFQNTASQAIPQTPQTVSLHSLKAYSVSKQSTEQQGTTTDAWLIKGFITDEENNNPLPGVIITIQGTTRGVCTGIDGRFEIRIAESDFGTQASLTLLISYVGYNSKHKVLTKQNTDLETIVLRVDSSVFGDVSIIKQSVTKRLWAKVKGFPRWITKPFRKN